MLFLFLKLHTSASFSLLAAFHLVDESLLFRVIGRSDLEETTECIAESFDHIGTGFDDFCSGTRFLFRLLPHRFGRGRCRLGLPFFIPVESLADDIVGASAVAVNLRSLELLPVLEIGKTIDFGRATSEFLPYRYTFLCEFSLKCSPVLCRFLSSLNGEINFLTSLRSSFKTLSFHLVFVLAVGQTILPFHLVAYLVVAIILKTVTNTFAVIIYPVIDDVAVRMLVLCRAKRLRR